MHGHCIARCISPCNPNCNVSHLVPPPLPDYPAILDSARFAGEGDGAEAPLAWLCLAGGLVQTTQRQHRQPFGRGRLSAPVGVGLKPSASVTPDTKRCVCHAACRPSCQSRPSVVSGTGLKARFVTPTDRPTMPTRHAAVCTNPQPEWAGQTTPRTTFPSLAPNDGPSHQPHRGLGQRGDKRADSLAIFWDNTGTLRDKDCPKKAQKNPRCWRGLVL